MEHAVHALGESGARVVVLVGEASPVPCEHVRTVDGLAYADKSSVTGRELATSLMRAARDGLDGPPDIWHVHNHSLGKNLALPEAVHHLASENERLLLQVHDFAEDGRPDNYGRLKRHLGSDGAATMGTKLYPQAPQVHYAALNRRDRGFLAAAGVDRSRLHLLPNAVADDTSPTSVGHDDSPERRLYLYPTRAIRRKNLGEFLLWAALAPSGDRFATTLAPENPAHLPVYDRWRAFARELALPVEFGIGTSSSLPFAELVLSARRLVTTSVAEGFGMAFLEPWLFRRSVLGRNLEEITVDFTRAGIDLTALYPRLGVPVEWIDSTLLREKVADRLERSWQVYGRDIEEDSVEETLRSAVEGGRIDFGRLDEPLQEEVIRRLAETPSAATEISPSRLESEAVEVSVIRRNEDVVRQQFGLSAYGDRLLEIYRRIVNSPVDTPGPLRTDILLDQFLAPERFSLLRA